MTRGPRVRKQDLVVDLAESFLERRRRGERPTIGEYAERHPDLADEIREVFPALLFVEECASEDGKPDSACSSVRRSDHAWREDHATLRELGEYRILGEVGRGGMGVVYEAEQVSLGRHVALKVFPFHALLDERRLQRFQLEARAVAALQHPNIVPVHGVGEDHGIHYYAMQFITGQGLDRVIEQVRRERDARLGSRRAKGRESSPSEGTEQRVRSLDETSGRRRAAQQEHAAGRQVSSPASSSTADSSALLTMVTDGSSEHQLPYFRGVARIGAQAAKALAYAHHEGVLHRDIKPSNLLLDERGDVWITDFGLAKVEGSDDLTLSGEVLGTLRYMAPEGLRGWSDPRSDVYSLGLTLYEILTLRSAFDDDDRARLIRRVAEEEPHAPRRLVPTIPRDLETVVLKAIAKDPGNRYTTADELAADLQRFLDGEPIAARRSNAWKRGVKWARRRPGVAALLAISSTCVLLLLVGAILYAARVKTESHRRDILLETARAPVTELLTRMAERRPKTPREAQEAQLALLESILRFYEEFKPATAFGGERPNPPDVQYAVAQAYRLLGDSHGNLRLLSEAADDYRRAVDLFEELQVGAVAHDFRKDKFFTYMVLCTVHALQGEQQEAQEAYSRAILLLDDPPGFRFDVQGVSPAGRETTGIVAADLDGDGNTDLVTADHGSDTVSVLVNDGSGSFAPPLAHAVGRRPFSLTTADLDRDGIADLAVANKDSSSVSVLLGRGDGSFGPSVNYAVRDQAFSVKAADIDRDGDIDLVAAGGKSNVSILFNDGPGTFSKIDSITVDLLPNHVAIADLDNDGDLDLAVACSGSGGASTGSVSLSFNDGQGRFSPVQRIAAGKHPAGVVCRDLDGRGRPELVTSSPSHGTISVIRGNQDGSFQETEQYEAGEQPLFVLAEDVDADGDPDLVVTDSGYLSHRILVFLNDGAGHLGWPLSLPSGTAPYCVVATDLSGDGRVDIAVANFQSNDVWVLRNRRLTGG